MWLEPASKFVSGVSNGWARLILCHVAESATEALKEPWQWMDSETGWIYTTSNDAVQLLLKEPTEFYSALENV